MVNRPTAIQTSKLIGNRRRPAPPTQAQVDAMVESIRSLGRIVEPLVVIPLGSSYEVLHGEVRWLAAKQLKIDIVPIRVVELDGHVSAAASLISNLEPESIAPEEVISGLESLVSEFGNEAAETVMDRLPELREIFADSSNFRVRIGGLLASCGIDSQVLGGE